MVPMQELLDDPETRELVKDEGCLVMNIASDRRIVWYPCANYKLMNFLVIHPSSESKVEGVGELATTARARCMS